MSAHPIYLATIAGIFATLYAELAWTYAATAFNTWLDRRWQTGTVPRWVRVGLRLRDGRWSA